MIIKMKMCIVAFPWLAEDVVYVREEFLQSLVYEIF
jgi:hypothetical protein